MHAIARFVEWPWALVLALLLPLGGTLLLDAERRGRRRRLARLGTRAMVTALAPVGARLGGWRTARLLAALALAGVALAGPRWGVGRAATHSTGADVVLALDASLSMLATDGAGASGRPETRLEAMKNVVRQLRAASPGDRFALTAFAGHGYVLSPLTTDGGALDLYLDHLDPQTVGVAGTSLAGALEQATTLLGDKTAGRSRVIVLMSDGEGFEPPADLAAEAARAGGAGITVVAVGFGTPQGTTIPVQDSTGRATLKRGPDGDVVVTRYSPALLQIAATAAGRNGVFVPADVPDKAARIRRVLDGMQKRGGAVVAPEDLAPQYQWFAGVALGLLMLDTLLILRPRRRKLPRRRDESWGRRTTVRAPNAVPTPVSATRAKRSAASAAAVALAGAGASTAAALACALALVCLASCAAPVRSSAPVGRRGDSTLVGAYNRGTRLLPRDPLPDAVAALDSAVRSKDSAVRARAVYNGGWAYLVSGLGMERQTPSFTGAPVVRPGPGPRTRADSVAIDSALARYRAALRLNPDDADARWNYELAIRHRKINAPKKSGQQGPRQQQQPPRQPAPGRPDVQQPPRHRVEQIHVDPQQAEALLDAAARHESKALRIAPPRGGPPPQGKDW